MALTRREKGRCRVTIVHAQVTDREAVLPRKDFDRLLQMARLAGEVEVRTERDEIPTHGVMVVAEQGGAFDWLADEEDLYTVSDLKVRYR